MDNPFTEEHVRRARKLLKNRAAVLTTHVVQTTIGEQIYAQVEYYEKHFSTIVPHEAIPGKPPLTILEDVASRAKKLLDIPDEKAHPL